MEDSEVIGYMSNILFTNEREESGDWRASYTLVQGILPQGSTWDNRKVEFVAVHKDKDKALGDLMFTVSTYLSNCKNDLFTIKRGEPNVEIDSNEVAQ